MTTSWRHDDVIKWKHFPRNWPFVQEIHRSPVNFPHKGQWRGALMFSLIYAWINDWVNNREAGDLRRQHGHYDFIVMWTRFPNYWPFVVGIHRWPVDSHHKGPVMRNCDGILVGRLNNLLNNRSCDLGCLYAHVSGPNIVHINDLTSWVLNTVSNIILRHRMFTLNLSSETVGVLQRYIHDVIYISVAHASATSFAGVIMNIYTTRFRYLAAHFLQSSQRRRPIARP